MNASRSEAVAHGDVVSRVDGAWESGLGEAGDSTTHSSCPAPFRAWVRWNPGGSAPGRRSRRLPRTACNAPPRLALGSRPRRRGPFTPRTLRDCNRARLTTRGRAHRNRRPCLTNAVPAERLPMDVRCGPTGRSPTAGRGAPCDADSLEHARSQHGSRSCALRPFSGATNLPWIPDERASDSTVAVHGVTTSIA